MFTLGKYSKFWIALIAFLVTTLGIYFGSAPWFPILITFLGAIGVYATPNTRV